MSLSVWHQAIITAGDSKILTNFNSKVWAIGSPSFHHFPLALLLDNEIRVTEIDWSLKKYVKEKIRRYLRVCPQLPRALLFWKSGGQHTYRQSRRAGLDAGLSHAGRVAHPTAPFKPNVTESMFYKAIKPQSSIFSFFFFYLEHYLFFPLLKDVTNVITTFLNWHLHFYEYLKEAIKEFKIRSTRQIHDSWCNFPCADYCQLHNLADAGNIPALPLQVSSRTIKKTFCHASNTSRISAVLG